MIKNNKTLKLNRGTTLIEVLLYIVIASILLGVISAFTFVLLSSRVKNQTISEVNSQGVFISEMIERTIRSGEAVNTPLIGTSSETLSVDVLNSSLDPTIFSLSSGVLYVKEGFASNIALSNSKVVISNLIFRNLSIPSTPGSVHFSFNISHVNNAGRNEFSYSKTFAGSASIR